MKSTAATFGQSALTSLQKGNVKECLRLLFAHNSEIDKSMFGEVRLLLLAGLLNNSFTDEGCILSVLYIDADDSQMQFSLAEGLSVGRALQANHKTLALSLIRRMLDRHPGEVSLIVLFAEIAITFA